MKDLLLCVKYECRKSLLFKKGLLVIAVCFILNIAICLISQPEFYELAFSPDLYESYIEKFDGVYSQQTMEAINAEVEYQQSIINTPVQEEGLSHDEYVFQSERVRIAEEKIRVLDAVIKKCQSLENLQEYEPELVYDIEFTKYSDTFKQDWIALICIAILTISIVFGDIRCGMNQLLYSSKIGKSKVIKGKILTVIILSLIIATVFSLAQIMIISVGWELGNLQAPIQSFAGFENCGIEISMLEGICIGILLKVISAVAAALLLILLSALLKNEVLSISVMTIIIGGGALGESGGVFAVFDLSAYLSGVQVVAQVSATRAIVMLPVLFIALVLFTIGGYKLQKRS